MAIHHESCGGHGVTGTDPAWPHPLAPSTSVRLEIVPSTVLEALANGDSSVFADARVSPYLAGEDWRSLWRLRWAQVQAKPDDAPWVTRFIVDPSVDGAVGIAGFHQAPDAAGMVEIGYAVDPALRRRGYARRALEVLLAVARDRAEAHGDVTTVRATISPANMASIDLVTAFGFAERGEQWDDEDGLEIIYELDVAPSRR